MGKINNRTIFILNFITDFSTEMLHSLYFHLFNHTFWFPMAMTCLRSRWLIFSWIKSLTARNNVAKNANCEGSESMLVTDLRLQSSLETLSATLLMLPGLLSLPWEALTDLLGIRLSEKHIDLTKSNHGCTLCLNVVAIGASALGALLTVRLKTYLCSILTNVEFRCLTCCTSSLTNLSWKRFLYSIS